MFDFTKEVVINSADQILKTGDESVFAVHGGGRYFKKNIVGNKVYVTYAESGKPFELVIDWNTIKGKVSEGDIQILVELGLDRGDARGDWGSAMYYFKKPLLITVSKDADVEKVAEAFTKVGASYGMISAEEAESGVVLKGGDDKIKVRGVKVLNITGKDDVVSEVEYEWDAKALYTPNKVEFGTANYLLHNLRLPTYENYRFTSPAVVEMPIAGAKYTQYVFLYCVERPGLGGLSVAGQTNHSTTTHVFFVNEAVASKFEEVIGDSLLQKPMVSRKDDGVMDIHDVKSKADAAVQYHDEAVKNKYPQHAADAEDYRSNPESEDAPVEEGQE